MTPKWFLRMRINFRTRQPGEDEALYCFRKADAWGQVGIICAIVQAFGVIGLLITLLLEAS